MTNSDDVPIHALDAVLDHEGVRELAAFVSRHGDGPVEIDATGVRKMGALAAQVLTVAAHAQAQQGRSLVVTDPDGVVLRCLDRLGLTSALSGALIMKGSEP